MENKLNSRKNRLNIITLYRNVYNLAQKLDNSI